MTRDGFTGAQLLQLTGQTSDLARLNRGEMSPTVSDTIHRAEQVTDLVVGQVKSHSSSGSKMLESMNSGGLGSRS